MIEFVCDGCHLKCSIRATGSAKPFAPKSCPYNMADMRGVEMSQWSVKVKE